MNNQNKKWLIDEIPKWTDAGIIDDASGQRIKALYPDSEGVNWFKVMLAIFGTLGALLVGGGIILLFAKNWGALGIPERTVLSFLPLLIGQIIGVYVLLRKNDSIAWREGTAGFIFLGVGAAISLISQTYNISGDASSFSLTWMLLTLPLVYIFSAYVPCFFYFIGITVWLGSAMSENGHLGIYWILFGAGILFVIMSMVKGTNKNQTYILLWNIAINLCIVLGMFMSRAFPGLWIVTFASYFTLIFLLGKYVFNEDDPFWQKSLNIIGLIGGLVIAFQASFVWPWKDVESLLSHRINVPNYLFSGYIITGAVFMAAIGLFVFTILKKDNLRLVYGFSFLPAAILVGFIIFHTPVFVPQLVFNVYLFLVGLYTVIHGINKQHLGYTNFGMLIISLLIIMRFFDMDLDFYIRGICFIFVGVGFLVSNLILVNRRKEVTKG